MSLTGCSESWSKAPVLLLLVTLSNNQYLYVSTTDYISRMVDAGDKGAQWESFQRKKLLPFNLRMSLSGTDGSDGSEGADMREKPPELVELEAAQSGGPVASTALR